MPSAVPGFPSAAAAAASANNNASMDTDAPAIAEQLGRVPMSHGASAAGKVPLQATPAAPLPSLVAPATHLPVPAHLRAAYANAATFGEMNDILQQAGVPMGGDHPQK